MRLHDLRLLQFSQGRSEQFLETLSLMISLKLFMVKLVSYSVLSTQIAKQNHFGISTWIHGINNQIVIKLKIFKARKILRMREIFIRHYALN